MMKREPFIYSIAVTTARLTLSLAVCASLSSIAHARDAIEIFSQYDSASDIDGGGEFSNFRFGINAGVPLYRGEEVNGTSSILTVAARYEYDAYDFDGVPALWGDVESYALSTLFRTPLSSLPFLKLTRPSRVDNWHWITAAQIGTSGESGADFSDSLRWSAVTIFNYEPSDKLTIGPGFLFTRQIEEDFRVIPILSLDWKFADHWNLATGAAPSGASGANVSLSYKPSDSWIWSTGVSYSSKRFRLDSSNSLSNNGVGDQSGARWHVSIRRNFKNGMSATFLAGLRFSEELTVEDSSGNEILERDTDAAPFFGLNFGMEF